MPRSSHAAGIGQLRRLIAQSPCRPKKAARPERIVAPLGHEALARAQVSAQLFRRAFVSGKPKPVPQIAARLFVPVDARLPDVVRLDLEHPKAPGGLPIALL